MNSSQHPFENIPLRTDFTDCAGKITISVFKSEIRSWVPYFVYLPPGWTPDQSYPLVVFLHGQGGDETTFNKYVKAEQINSWIQEGKLDPVVIVGVRGDNERDNVQWFTEENEALLQKEKGGEFIRFCMDSFKAGENWQNISLEGHSRGAAGAIHYYLKCPGLFTSVTGMGYVSDYTLAENCSLAKQNAGQLKSKAIPLRLEIGTEDRFVQSMNRRCSFQLHQFLLDLGIGHCFDVLHGVEHGFDTFWNYNTEKGIINGLSHLQFHEKARKEKYKSIVSRKNFK